jgi:hypothetical protein
MSISTLKTNFFKKSIVNPIPPETLILPELLKKVTQINKNPNLQVTMSTFSQ